MGVLLKCLRTPFTLEDIKCECCGLIIVNSVHAPIYVYRILLEIAVESYFIIM